MDFKIGKRWRAVKLAAALSCLGSLPLAGENPDGPTDPCWNPFVNIESAFLVPSDVKGESQIEITFNKEVSVSPDCVTHGFGALNVPIDSVASLGMALFKNLAGNESLDLVVGQISEVWLYENTATAGSGKFVFDKEPVLLAKRKRWNYTTGELVDEHHAGQGTSIAFEDLNRDGFIDLVCGEGYNGDVSFFAGAAPVDGIPQFPGKQEFLKYRDADGQEDFISTARSGASSPDKCLASPVFFDVNGDTLLDLIVGDSKQTDGGNLHVFLARDELGTGVQETTTGINPGSVVPLYKEPFMLTAGTSGLPVAVEDRYAGATTPSFADVDGDGSPDLVVSNTAGIVYYYPYIGQSPSTGLALFGDRNSVESSSGGLLNFPGSSIVAKGVNLNGDGHLDFVTTSLSSIAPFRREIRVHLSDDDGKVDREGFVLGSKNSPFKFRGAQEANSWTSGDLNADGFEDLLFAQLDGRLAVSLSTDTSNDFDAQFSSFSYVRNADGTVFNVRQLNDLDGEGNPDIYPHASSSIQRVYCSIVDIDGVASTVNGNQLYHPDAIVLGLKDAIVVLPLVSFDDDGCVNVGVPYSITPSGMEGTAIVNTFQVEFGRFPATGGQGNAINGAIIH